MSILYFVKVLRELHISNLMSFGVMNYGPVPVSIGKIRD